MAESDALISYLFSLHYEDSDVMYYAKVVDTCMYVVAFERSHANLR